MLYKYNKNFLIIIMLLKNQNQLIFKIIIELLNAKVKKMINNIRLSIYILIKNQLIKIM